jgi:glyoxylase-like metal-dependent hydrolase (beta-lactamase superfamily II)
VADLTPGVPNALRPLVRRIVSPTGTNTYLVGIDEIAVIDPGSADPDHVDAIVGCGGDRIRWVLVTSTARGHADGAAAVKARTGAEVLGFGAGDGFLPDVEIGEGYELEATEFRLLALHTPGVAADHLCYLLEDDRIVLTGDLVRGDGEGDDDVPPQAPVDLDTAGWLASIERLSKLRPPLRGIGPGHGHFIDDAKTALAHQLRAA